MNRSLKVLSTVLGIVLAARAAPAPAGETRLALVVPGASSAPGETSLPPRPDDATALARAIGARIVPEESLLAEETRLVLLTGSSVEAMSGWSEERVDRLAAAVRRPGSGLVVVGDAAAALPNSKAYSKLLGRKEMSTALGAAPPPAPGMVLPVIDQEGPITQCLTHWVLRRGRLTAEGAPEEPAAIVALSPPRSVLWLPRAGSRRVVVLGIQPPADRDDREADLITALTTRSLQFVAGREITCRLPEKLPLLATALLEPPHPDLPTQPGFYLGRQIAPVMGYGGASWLVREDREGTEQPEKVLDALEIREGSTVADLGAGVGYFSFRLARRVGAKGKVLAVDLQPEMVSALKARAAETCAANVEAILSTEDDPRLPPGAVDLVLMVDVYHELADPAPVMRAVARSLRPKGDGSPPGRLALVEYRGEDPTVPIKPLHRTTLEQVRAELSFLRFRWIETKEFLPHQRIIVFE